MQLLRIALALGVLLIVAAGAFVLWSQRSEIAAIEPPQCAAFDRALIEQGERLAAIGNCDVCRTMPGGPAYAGARPVPTPFGTIYSTNITPDAETGIGRWPADAFRRAMREGIARDGRHLYPAFPYDHYARDSDDDIRALYAFVMTRPPVSQRPPQNALAFPLNQRWTVAFWNLLYLDGAPFRPDPQRSPEWNRGAYLVDGIAAPIAARDARAVSYLAVVTEHEYASRQYRTKSISTSSIARPRPSSAPAKRRRAQPRRIANAIADAAGVRLRDIPLTAARVKAAIGV